MAENQAVGDLVQDQLFCHEVLPGLADEKVDNIRETDAENQGCSIDYRSQYDSEHSTRMETAESFSHQEDNVKPNHFVNKEPEPIPVLEDRSEASHENPPSDDNSDKLRECQICCEQREANIWYTVPKCRNCIDAWCCDRCVVNLVRMCFTGYDCLREDYVNASDAKNEICSVDIEIVEHFCYYMCPFCRDKVLLYDSVVQRSRHSKDMNAPGIQWLHSAIHRFGYITGQSQFFSNGFNVSWRIACETSQHLCFSLQWGAHCDECMRIHSPREMHCIIRLPCRFVALLPPDLKSVT